MDLKDKKYSRVTMQNYQHAFKNFDSLIRYGNHYYISNTRYNEISNMVPKPVPKNTHYKHYNIKF